MCLSPATIESVRPPASKFIISGESTTPPLSILNPVRIWILSTATTSPIASFEEDPSLMKDHLSSCIPAVILLLNDAQLLICPFEELISTPSIENDNRSLQPLRLGHVSVL